MLAKVILPYRVNEGLNAAALQGRMVDSPHGALLEAARPTWRFGAKVMIPMIAATLVAAALALERDNRAGSHALDALVDVDDESYALCAEALAGFDRTGVGRRRRGADARWSAGSTTR